jgi:SAM-dependent methyltransferase
VALIAARRGAEVTGLDISADQLGKARAASDEAGLSIRFDEGDAQALPYGNADFDVIASAFGIIFAPDPQLAADELARVCRPGARIAVTAWPEDDWGRLGRRLRPEEFEGNHALDWADEAFVRRLLPGFELSFASGEAVIASDSPESLWELLAKAVPPLKNWLATLSEDERAAARSEYMQLFDGGRLERTYVLTVGAKA